MSESVNQPILYVENLGKSVASLDASTNQPLVILHDIHLSVMPGESLAIIGPSGSGKSTLLGLLAGLDTPSTGSIHLAGENMGQMNEDQRAALRGEKLGFIFQSFQLLPTFTALENVMLPMELSDKHPSGESGLGLQQQAEQLLSRVGLGERLQHYPAQLSGGEQQRVAIARAFLSRPALLLADEPTGNLDAHTGQRIIDLMFELNTEHQTTLVLVTHDSTLADRCDRVMALHDGCFKTNADVEKESQSTPGIATSDTASTTTPSTTSTPKKSSTA
ncbi:MAG: ABC transporter ATP-binding protein [Ectothiorhodospiraceae bacterium]|nr:ABC transporter ATP-binding protein [Ectothiorhodospiraceae bacterium]